MRKGLYVSGVCGCALAIPAVAHVASADTAPIKEAGSGGAAENAARIDAALKRHTLAEIPLHHRRLADERRRRRDERQAQQDASQASGGDQSAAGGASPQLQAIAQCESSGDPSARSGQYGGLYQFDQQTWESVGGSGDPASASPGEQSMRAEMLLQQRGTSAWPVCGRGQ